MNKAFFYSLTMAAALTCGGCVVAPYEYSATGYYSTYRPLPSYYSSPPTYYRAPYVEVVPAWPYYGPSVYRSYGWRSYDGPRYCRPRYRW